MFDDDEMQENFQSNFFKRPIARGRNFYSENFTSLLKYTMFLSFKNGEIF